MSKKYLYINSKGSEVWSHSFSAGEVYRFCPQKYKLQKINGWNEKETSAARLFGMDLEAAIRFYHENEKDLGQTVQYFRDRWDHAKELAIAPQFSNETLAYLKNAGLRSFRPGFGVKYTQTEGSWSALRASGEEMLRLYHVRHKTWPIDLSSPRFQELVRKNRAFQLKYSKELFPGTEWAGVEFVAYIDLIAPYAAAVSGLAGVDIKTASVGLDTTPGILALDQQLRTYAWATAIPDWFFKWFQKVGRTLEKGSRISLLEDAGKFWAGSEAVVIKFQAEKEAEPADPFKPKSKPKEAVPEEVWIVENDSIIEQMEKSCGTGQTNAEKDARNLFIRENATLVPKSSLTKQRIQFVHAHIGLAEQAEAAQLVKRDVAAILDSNEENFWPQVGSIRGMDKKCLNCQMRGLCLNNNDLRDKLIFRTDDEWDNQED